MLQCTLYLFGSQWDVLGRVAVLLGQFLTLRETVECMLHQQN